MKTIFNVELSVIDDTIHDIQNHKKLRDDLAYFQASTQMSTTIKPPAITN